MARALTSYPTFEDATRAADAMGALRDELRRHLAHEEDAALPYVVDHLSAQWPAFEAQQRKDTGLSGLTRLLPWLLTTRTWCGPTGCAIRCRRRCSPW